MLLSGTLDLRRIVSQLLEPILIRIRGLNQTTIQSSPFFCQHPLPGTHEHSRGVRLAGLYSFFIAVTNPLMDIKSFVTFVA